jgi:hypothetical protein
VVASQNWIGFSDVQDVAVPITKVWHLVRHITETASLTDSINWLMDRRYLPKEGTDFAVQPVERSCGNWKATWYGIEPLNQEPEVAVQNA